MDVARPLHLRQQDPGQLRVHGRTEVLQGLPGVDGLYPGEPERFVRVAGTAGEELRDDAASPLAVRLRTRCPGLLEIKHHRVGTVGRRLLDLFPLAPGTKRTVRSGLVCALFRSRFPLARSALALGRRPVEQ